jgi:hypothetical protein
VAHPLSQFGGADDYPPAVWETLATSHAEERARRFLGTPGHPIFHDAALHLGTRTRTLTDQFARLEAAAGAALLYITSGEDITLTREGEQFAGGLRQSPAEPSGAGPGASAHATTADNQTSCLQFASTEL